MFYVLIISSLLSKLLNTMATTKLMLNKYRCLNDGTYPLVMQVLHRRRKRVIYTKIHLYPNEFNESGGMVVSCKLKYRTTKEIKALNREIKEFCSMINDIIVQFDHSGLHYTPDDIVQKYNYQKQGSALCLYWRQQITLLEHSGRHGMAEAYRSTLNSVRRFAKSSDIAFSQITIGFISRYYLYLLSISVSPNTIGYYMRNFRSLLNSAVKEKMMADPKTNLFSGIDVRPQKTVKRALNREQLKVVAEMTFDGSPEQELFSFYTRGMAFVDIAYLRKEQILANTLRYTRRKTKQLLQISINEQASRLIAKYKSGSRYLFPLISSEDNYTAYKEYRTALRNINMNLKIIGQRVGIGIPLTTYVARHSWATQAKERGAPMSVISEGLGHTSEQITQIYLKQFDQSVLDNINDIVSEL
jgi:site-specific recombinase XerD